MPSTRSTSTGPLRSLSLGATRRTRSTSTTRGGRTTTSNSRSSTTATNRVQTTETRDAPDTNRGDTRQDDRNRTRSTFALAPGQVKVDTYLDYTNKEDVKIFDINTKPLSIKLDTDPKTINIFQRALMERSYKAGFLQSDANILEHLDSNMKRRNVILQYGCIDLTWLNAEVRTYIATKTRRAQNEYMLFVLIKDSITEAAMYKY